MASTLKRQLTDDEKKLILDRHGRRCWATGIEIGPDEPLHFDHINAFVLDGASELDNIAPMCADCNLQKGTLTLADFRVKLRLQKFFQQGDTLTLGDLLDFLKREHDLDGYGAPVSVVERDGTVTIGSAADERTYALYTCPRTGWKYFYATLDVAILDSDDERDQAVGLQPRYLIFDKVFDLYRHFQRYPVLLPSLGRLVGNRLRLFDGQHKAAGLLMTGRRSFECKIYLDPDIRLLNQTNIAAHDKFAQTRFFSSIMVLKLGSQFGTDFEEYKNLDDGEAKSEAAFMKWLSRKEGGLARADLNKRFRSYLYNAVIDHEDNRLKRLISSTNRGTDEKPLTIDQLSKSIFACFLYTEPVADNMTTDAYCRDKELANVVALMNMVHDLALHSWDPKRGDNDENQRRLVRMFRSKATMAWSELLKDAVCATLELHDSDEQVRPFYRDLSSDRCDRVKKVVARLVNWKWWAAPASDEIDRILSDNKSEVKAWFKSKGLTTGYLMGAPE